jgi:glutamate/tyrosine decarboxylase-like PLP-dependent enzyme
MTTDATASAAATPPTFEEPDAGTTELLRTTAERAIAYRASLPTVQVGPSAGLTYERLRAGLDQGLPQLGLPPEQVIAELEAAMGPGLVAMAGPRYFGFVIGGGVPAALAADWLAATWDQNAGLYLATPAASVIEEVVGEWLVDLLGLPSGTTVGLTTGATMANFTALAAARHAVLRQAGWDVEANGLIAAPAVDVVVGADLHASMVIALRLLGFGRDRPIRVPTDDEGRMRTSELRRVLRELGGRDRPTIVAAQAGEVNTGAFDDFESIATIVREERDAAWLHVDGAFGLWAAAVPSMRGQIRGIERADSWSTDAHKWLNVPYDCGFAFVWDASAHRAAMGVAAAYLPPAPGRERDPFDYVPEMSRRARGIPVWAALRSLGRDGVAELVERCCSLARRMAESLARAPGVTILNEVVLNQVLVRFDDDDARTRAVIAAVQEDGTAWLGGTTWHGRTAMRISVSNWWTREADADATTDAILRAYRSVGGRA